MQAESGNLPAFPHAFRNRPLCGAFTVGVGNTQMPIFKYFALVGSVLMAFLFVADATMEKGASPVPVSSFQGLPKPWKPDPTKTLAAVSAPEPDMSSAAVLAAAPKTEPAPAPAAQAVQAEAPKKKIVRRQPAHDWRESYAWSRHDRFGGNNGGFYGRF